MKLLASTLALLLAFSTAFAGQKVGSANIMGYAKKAIPSDEYTLLGVNFGDENQTLLDVMGTNQLIGSSDFTTADRIVVFDRTSYVYNNYALKTPQNEFYPCNTVMEWYTSPATNPIIPVGSAFWILPASGSSGTNTIMLSGDVITAPTSTVDIVAGYQMMSYPISSETTLGTMSISNLTQNADFTAADVIMIWNGGSYSKYGLKNDGKWYPCNTVMEWYTSPAETNLTIDINEGYWLVAQNATNYIVPNSYFDSL